MDGKITEMSENVMYRKKVDKVRKETNKETLEEREVS